MNDETAKDGWRHSGLSRLRSLIGKMPVIIVIVSVVCDRVVAMAGVFPTLVAVPNCGRNDPPCQHQG